MPVPSPTPEQIALSFTHALRIRAEIARKEQAIRKRSAVLAKGLAALMEPGTLLYRRGIGIHAFEVDGSICLAATYTDEERDQDRYRYAVLCGGEVAKRGLRTAELDPGDSDEPGPKRRIALATYAECEDFLDRLATFIADATRRLQERLARTQTAEERLLAGRRALTAVKRRRAATR